MNLWYQLSGFFIAADLHIFFKQSFGNLRNNFFCHFAVNHQRFAGVAGAQTLGLGIYDNVYGHIQISKFIYVYMAVAGSGLDYRYGAVFHYSTDQAGTASGNQHINVAIQAHHFPGSLMRGVGHQLNAVLWHSRRNQCIPKNLCNSCIGRNSVTAASQDHSVSGLKAKAKSICRYIRTGFINNADHTEGDSHLSDHQTVRTFFHGKYLSDGIIQCYDLLQPLGHSVDTGGIYHQTV